MVENAPTNGAAPAPSIDPLNEPDPDGPPKPAPPPVINVEEGPPRIVIGYVQNKLRAETRSVGEQMNAQFIDVGHSDTAYFELIKHQWESGRSFMPLEEDVVPTPALLHEMWACEREWCSAFFWAWDGAVMDGESRPQRPRRYRVSATLALNKFGSSLLRRAPRAMQEAVARTNDRQHFNQLDLVLVNPGGVLQGPPYHAVPHVHGPVEHRTPPAWVSLIAADDWVDA
jgi:hypothetical protein